MPSRSSRSSPASRTSLSEPTGSASLAIAITGSLTTPVVGLADPAEPVLRLGVAESAVEPGLVERARVEAEAGGRLVVAGEVGVEHRRVVGRDRAADAGGDEPRQRVVLEAGDGAGAEVRERADVEDRAAVGELPHEA